MNKKYLFLGIILITTLIAASGWARPAAALPPVPEFYPGSDVYPAQVRLNTQAELAALNGLRLDVDDMYLADGGRAVAGDMPFQPRIAEVYITPAEAALLAQNGLTATPIPNEGARAFQAYGPGSGAPNAWPTYAQYVTRMQNLTDAYPDIMRLVSIGKSIQNRDLWCMKISDNPDAEENEPEFKYTAAIHGDETVGIEIIMRLAELLANNYGTDPDLTALVDGLETWLCPFSNPDGYVLGQRYNVHGVDLNRDFPDPLVDPVDDPAGHETETQVFMYFGYDHRFVMGANYHGGTEVVNYPWDAEGHTPIHSPDNAVFYDYSIGYAARNAIILGGGFTNGVTEGWEWYTIYGGMQDWAYVWRGEHHVTIELSNDKMPPYEQMDTYWDNNEESMVWWMQRALTGVRGRVLDALTLAPLDATVTLVGKQAPNTVRTDPDAGDYHRIVYTNTYTLRASAEGYVSQDAVVSVDGGEATVHDFYLNPLPADLEPSTKQAGSSSAIPGARLEYTLALVNDGGSTAAAITDTLPLNVTWAGELTATQGTPVYDNGTITWDGLIQGNSAITVTYAVTANTCLPAGATVENTAQFDDRAGNVWLRTASVDILDGAPTLPLPLTPADGALGQPITTTLSWEGSADPNCSAVTYNVAFGTSNPPPVAASGLTATTFDPGPLEAHTTYYWQITASDGVNQVSSAVQSFTTLNHAPQLPALLSPGDGDVHVPLTQTLQWQSNDLDGDLITYTVYFGTGNPPPMVTGELTVGVYDPVLVPGQTYYWYVVADDGYEQVVGPVWSFTVEGSRIFLPLIDRP